MFEEKGISFWRTDAILKNWKNFELCVSTAFLGGNQALLCLAQAIRQGSFGFVDTILADYIEDLANGKRPKTISQYFTDIERNQTKRAGLAENDVIAEENVHLEQTIRLINDRIARLRSQIESGFSAYFNDLDVQLDRSSKVDEVNELNYIAKSPYYGRLDVVIDDENKVETYYIGERMLNLGGEYDIFSVWSPFGSHFRNRRETKFTIKDNSYTVILRRQIELQNGKVFNVVDTSELALAEKDATNDLERIEDTYLGLADPFLKGVLAQKRGEKNISNIICSIQEKQNDIIDFDFDKNLIVQGCAGSGKTMILLHRLANLKYNRPKTKWNSVKIITPNSQFNTYIDDLTNNLGINVIPKRTLAEYYIEILQRYADMVNVRSSKNIEWIIEPDEWLAYEIVSFIYSDAFANSMKEEKEQLKERVKRISGFKAKYREIRRTVFRKIKEFTMPAFYYDKEEWEQKTTQCLLYAEVLACYFIWGTAPEWDEFLCIDEGQDISQLQYLLLYRVNGNNVCFNIYGDVAQKLENTCGISSWTALQKFIKDIPGKTAGEEVHLFELQENYRNSEEIVTFCNRELYRRDKALGIKIGRNVRNISADNVITWCKFHSILKNRIAVIYKDTIIIPNEVRMFCREEQIPFLTVKEAKGLEFDIVIVFTEGMSEIEKYIAYTRSMSELFIV